MDILPLEMMEYHARHLYREVVQTRIELSWQGDGKAMSKQAQAGVKFAVAAQEESRKAALLQYDLERELQKALDDAHAAMATNGIRWQDEFVKGQNTIKTAGLPPKVVETMRAAKISEEEIDAYRKRLLAVTPEELETHLAAKKAQLQMDASIRAALADNKSEATWPEPLDILPLEMMEYHARHLYREVVQTRIELSWQGMNEGVNEEEVKEEALLQWWAVPAESPPRLYEESLIKTKDSGPLLAGSYDVYVLQGEMDPTRPIPTAVRLAREVQVEEGKPAKVFLQTGLQITPVEAFPKPHSWFVVPCNASSTAIVAQRSVGSLEPLWLLPDKYDVYWIQSEPHLKRPILLARGVEVKENQLAAVPIQDAGIKLESAVWTPTRNKDYGWWGVVQTGDAVEYTVQLTASENKLLVPAGEYDVYWKQDHYHQPMLLASKVSVEENHVAEVNASSGIQFKVPLNTTALDSNYGWWGVVRAGGKPEEPIHRSKGKFDLPLLVPPGTYDIVWKQNHQHKPETVKRGAVVKENDLIEVEARPPNDALPR